jgi:hypothetical protein
MKRRRFRQKESLKERLASFAEDMRARASRLAPGTKQDDLLMKARQADTALHIDEWANSSRLPPPK